MDMHTRVSNVELGARLILNLKVTICACGESSDVAMRHVG